MNRRTLLVPLAALAVAACKDKEPEVPAGVISRDRFVAANVAVRLLSDTAPQAARDSALKKAGATDRQLRAWVTAYSRHPETLAKTWEEIAFKVDSVSGARPTPQGAGTPPVVVGAPVPVQLPINEDSILRRDDSLRFRRPPRPRPRRPGDEALPKADIHVQQ